MSEIVALRSRTRIIRMPCRFCIRATKASANITFSRRLQHTIPSPKNAVISEATPPFTPLLVLCVVVCDSSDLVSYVRSIRFLSV